MKAPWTCRPPRAGKPGTCWGHFPHHLLTKWNQLKCLLKATDLNKVRSAYKRGKHESIARACESFPATQEPMTTPTPKPTPKPKPEPKAKSKPTAKVKAKASAADDDDDG